MNFTYDGKLIPTDGVATSDVRGDSRGRWLKNAGIRMAVLACVSAALLFLFLRSAFVSLLSGTLVMVCQTLMMELIFGMVMQRRQARFANECERKACHRNWNVVAWCAEALACAAVVAAFAIWVCAGK